jgi:hypothetical protein
MPDYLKVDDFLAWEAQLSRKLGHMSGDVHTVKGQMSSLMTTFIKYVNETDAYRLANDKRLGNINIQLADLRGEVADIKQTVGTLAQTVSQGFTLIFARLGIQP